MTMVNTAAPAWFKQFKKRAPGYLFILPSVTILTIFVVWPIFQTAWMSLHDWMLTSPQHAFTGLQNYVTLLSDERFWNALKNTAYYTLFVVPIRVVLALVIALILNQKLKGLPFFRACMFLPVIGSLATEAIIWSFLMDPDIGLISYYSRLLHLPSSEWLRSTTWAMPAIILVSVWRWFGFNMVVFLAGPAGDFGKPVRSRERGRREPLAKILAYHPAAAAPHHAFHCGGCRDLLLPGLRPGYVMTRGGPLFSTETLVTCIYHHGFELYSMGYASSWPLYYS